MLIEGQFPVVAPPHLLLAHLFDVHLMASCLPGCETLEPLADDLYRAVVVVAMAGIRARFDLQVRITRRDEANVWTVIRGEEGGQASTLQADSQVSLSAVPEGTLVRYRSEVAVTGRLGRFALGMMKKKAQNLGDEFAANLQAKLEAIGAGAASGMPFPAAGETAGLTRPARTSAETPSFISPTWPAPASATMPLTVSAASAKRTWWQALLAWVRGDRSTGSATKAGD